MTDLRKQQFQDQLDAYAAEHGLTPITVDQWDMMARQQLEAAVERGIVEIVGYDELGEPLYQGVRK